MLRLLTMLTVTFAVALPGHAHSPAPRATRTDGKPIEKEGGPLRVREGEIIELQGKLELSGDRAIFHPQDAELPLRVLENLALERITRVLSESRDDRDWIVSGMVTEYRGANYILIHKAIQRARKETPAK